MDACLSQYLIIPSLEVLVTEMLKESLNILLDWPGVKFSGLSLVVNFIVRNLSSKLLSKVDISI